MTMFNKISLAMIALAASAQTALANDQYCLDPNNALIDPTGWAAAGCANSVPELSPIAGVAALAAVLALVAFVWERRRAA